MAAILLIGYHSSKLMTLLSPPIAGRSMEVKLASQKWRQLQNKISQSIASSTKVINLDTALLGVFDSSNNSLSEPPVVALEDNNKIQQTVFDYACTDESLKDQDR